MFNVVQEQDKANLSDLCQYGFVFNWTQNSSVKSITVAKIVNGDIAGLVEFERQPENLCNYMWLIEVSDVYKGTGVAGSLLAYVGRDAIQAGFDGFVVFETKTALYDYYRNKYGAKPIDGRKLFFDATATKALIEKYLGGNFDDNK